MPRIKQYILQERLDKIKSILPVAINSFGVIYANDHCECIAVSFYIFSRRLLIQVHVNSNEITTWRGPLHGGKKETTHTDKPYQHIIDKLVEHNGIEFEYEILKQKL